jgi:uncharacterized phage protein (TIGR02220 family)
VRAYHKISPAIWRDEKVRAFTDDAKLAWIFMLTHPSTTPLGVLPATIAGLAAELGWKPGRFRKAIARAREQGMLEIDEGACYIGFRNWLRHNEPEGPNVVNGAWLKSLDQIPECAAKRRLIVRCREYLDVKAPEWKDGVKSIKAEVWDTFAVAPSHDPSGEPSPHPSPHGSGEQSPLLELQPHLQLQPQPDLSPNPPSGAEDGRSWLDLLNRETGADFKATKGNLGPIRARIAEGHTLADAEAVVQSRAREWTGTERAQYLRPSTVFGTKFDSYLQAAKHANNGKGRVNEAWKDQPAGEVPL